MSGKALEKLRKDLDVHPGAPAAPGAAGAAKKKRPVLGDGMHRAELLHSVAITAQVCVKAAARITGSALKAKFLSHDMAEDFASGMARRLMDDASDFINARMCGRTTKMQSKGARK